MKVAQHEDFDRKNSDGKVNEPPRACSVLLLPTTTFLDKRQQLHTFSIDLVGFTLIL